MKLTQLIILGIIAFLILFDIVVYTTYGVDATISRVVLAWARDIPIVVLFPGILIGHFFWPQIIHKDRSS